MNVTAQRLIKRCLPLVCLLPLLLPMACKKDTAADPRDAYAGRWIEQSTNGIPARAGLTDTLQLSKTTGSATRLTVAGLIRSGSFTTSPVTTGSGYVADNTPVNSGTEYRFLDGSRAPVTLDKLTLTVAGNQMTMTYSFSAKSTTQIAGSDFVEILIRQ